MLRDGPGVNEQTLTDILNRGGILRIKCLTSVTRRANAFPGEWVMLVSADGETWSLLELFAKKQARIFKTAPGLCGFMLDKGFSVCALPFRKGESIEISKDGRIRYNDANHA